MIVPSLFPNELITMFDVWYEKSGYKHSKINESESKIRINIKKAMTRFGIGLVRMELKGDFNLSKGDFKYRFKRFRLNAYGIDIRMKAYYRLLK
jgi:hypothetical protein